MKYPPVELSSILNFMSNILNIRDREDIKTNNRKAIKIKKYRHKNHNDKIPASGVEQHARRGALHVSPLSVVQALHVCVPKYLRYILYIIYNT
jgi:hypothetical protein